MSGRHVQCTKNTVHITYKPSFQQLEVMHELPFLLLYSKALFKVTHGDSQTLVLSPL